MKYIRLLIICFLLLETNFSRAQYTDLVNFTGTAGANPGGKPMGSLTLSDNIFYGITQLGGTNGYGDIFSYDPVGNIYTDLINFTGDTGAYLGKEAWGSLTLSGGILYGMTTKGGTNGKGVIFSYNPVGNIYTHLFDMADSTGKYPGGSLTSFGGLLYGMTIDGGSSHFGVIFSYDPVSNVYTDLVNFTGMGGAYPGANPYGSLTVSGGLLYGMTTGGGANHNGVIFSYDPIGNIYSELINFTDTIGPFPGAGPVSSLTLSGGVFYGVAGRSAGHNGLIFSFNPVGNVYNTLDTFTGMSGACRGELPLASLTLSDGLLYGNTWFGGAYGYGVIFSYDPTANVYTVVADLTGTGGSAPGANPGGSLTSFGGILYGMTALGGTDGTGVIYSLKDTISGVNNINARASIKIYPNPATTLLTVSADHINSIAITNLVGQTLYIREYNARQVQVDIANLPNGIYFARVNGTEVSKFIKQ